MKRLIPLLFTFFIPFMLDAQKVWKERTPYPGQARHHPITFTINQTAYLMGGTTGQSNVNDDMYKYDASADSWVQMSNFPGPARSFSYADVYDDKAYVGFGLGPGSQWMNDLWRFDPEEDEWTELSSCPCPGRRHPAFVAHKGKIFVGLGDNNNSGNLNDWWEYDIDGDSWRELPALPGVPRHHPFHFAAGDYVFAGMGHGASIYDDWYRWDPEADEWTEMSRFPDQARVAGTEFSHKGFGYVLSGDGSNHGAMSTGEFWRYDPENDEWVELPPHPGLSRWAPGSFVVGDNLYFTSGQVRTGPEQGLKNDVLMYQLDKWLTNVKENTTSEDVSFRVYPNPVEHVLNFEGLSSVKGYDVEVYNTSGQLLMNNRITQNQLDVSGLTSGIYIVKVKDENGHIEQSKFVK